NYIKNQYIILTAIFFSLMIIYVFILIPTLFLILFIFSLFFIFIISINEYNNSIKKLKADEKKVLNTLKKIEKQIITHESFKLTSHLDKNNYISNLNFQSEIKNNLNNVSKKIILMNLYNTPSHFKKMTDIIYNIDICNSNGNPIIIKNENIIKKFTNIALDILINKNDFIPQESIIFPKTSMNEILYITNFRIIYVRELFFKTYKSYSFSSTKKSKIWKERKKYDCLSIPTELIIGWNEHKNYKGNKIKFLISGMYNNYTLKISPIYPAITILDALRNGRLLQ
ncbi:MAG: hypothetical protein ACW99Q_08280, partial [Candidatus Kariarchaeaceae archaeon]